VVFEEAQGGGSDGHCCGHGPFDRPRERMEWITDMLRIREPECLGEEKRPPMGSGWQGPVKNNSSGGGGGGEKRGVGGLGKN